MSDEPYGNTALWISALVLMDFVLLMYVAFFKLSVIERSLKNCRIVSEIKSVWRGRDPVARLSRLAIISSIFIVTGLFNRRGLIDLDEVRRVPLGLRAWVVTPLVSSAVVSLLAGVYYFCAPGRS